MSVSYCILGINKNKLLELAATDGSFEVGQPDQGYVNISIVNDKAANRYALKKRIALAKAVQQPPDNIQSGNNQSSVFVDMNAPDEENTHFSGFAVSVNHPEIVLDKLVELANKYGFDDAAVLSEYDEAYQEMFMNQEEIEEDDLPT